MPVTLSDVGLNKFGVGRVRWDGPWLPIQTVTEMITFARDDLMLGRGAAASPPQELLGGQDLLSIVQSWTTTVADSSDSSGIGIRKGRQRIGDQEVMQIRAVTEVFRSLDNAYGGGRTCEAVIGQLISTASLIEDTTYTEEVGRKLITGMGDLAKSRAGCVTTCRGTSQLSVTSCWPSKQPKRPMTPALEPCPLLHGPASWTSESAKGRIGTDSPCSLWCPPYRHADGRCVASQPGSSVLRRTGKTERL